VTFQIETRTGGHLLRDQIWLPYRREDVFAFFSDAHNLERLTPEWLNFQILSSLDEGIREGSLIDYKLRLRGVPIRWQTEISVWEPSSRFVDEMRRGPYREWIHEHRFEERDDGTLMTDEVRYAVPGGGLVHRLLVRPDLERIFRYRREQLQLALREKFATVALSHADARRGWQNQPHAPLWPAKSRVRGESE